MYIITGGAGFLGSALIWELNKAGIENILVVDNLSTSDKWKNLVGLRYLDYVHRDSFIQSVRAKGFPSMIKGIVHLGACSDTTEQDSDFLMQNNTRFSIDLCTVALKHGARFVNISSAATYGDGRHGFDDNEDLVTRLRPLNMYGYSKHLFDLWLLQSKNIQRVASLKLFNVYGPNEYHKNTMRSVVCKAYEEITATGSLRLFCSNTPEFGDGEQMRDFIYVKDCTKIMAWFLQKSRVNGIFNVGVGKARTWNDLANAVFSALGQESNIEYIDMPASLVGKYQNFTQANTQKLLAADCAPCAYSLEDGVKDYVQNYLQDGKFLDVLD